MIAPGRTGGDLPVVVSVASGAGDGAERESILRDLLGTSFTPRFFYPRSLRELRSVVQDMAIEGASHVGVAGGDGTIHHAVNAIGDNPSILAPFPRGSGNDFCRAMGLTGHPAAPVRALMSGRIRRIDLLEVNGHRVCTVAGIGIVATTGVQIARLMAPGSALRPLLRGLGPYAYLGAAGLRLLLTPHTTAPARVRWRDRSGDWSEMAADLHGLFLANLATLGAGLRLPLTAESDDGYIEVVRLPKNRRLRLLWGLSCLRSGRPLPRGVIEIAAASEADIDWPGGSSLLGDGEDLGRFDRFHVRALPRALQVVSL